MSTAKPGTGKLVAEARMVVQLPGDVQESFCVLDGAGCCYSGDGLVKGLTKCMEAVNSSSGLKIVILC